MNEAKVQLVTCSLEIQIALLKGGNFSCIEKARQAVDSHFVAARDDLAENKSAQALLKDAHAYWLSSVTALIPTTGEKRSQYNQRIQQLQQSFDEKANRVLLEK